MKIFYIYIPLFLLIFVSACVRKEKVPPIIPSKETMTFDFSFFEQTSIDNTNFSFVSEKVLAWKPFLEDSIALHHEIINNALKNNLEFQKENTWLSNFSFNIDDNYSSKFFGIVGVDTVFYKTYLSYDTIIDFLYLEGKAYEDFINGEWDLLKPQVEEYEFISSKITTIEWSFIDRKHIRFTNKLAGSDNLNYIYYVDSTDNEYNTYLDIYNKGNENHSIIQWNNTDNNGRVKDNLRFGNNDWHYWDNNFQDIN